MPEPSIQQDIESLHREVQQRLGSYDASAQQWQEAMSEKHKRRVDEIALEVVRQHYGYVVQEAVQQLRRCFLLE